jgi:hypothetical protein
VTTGTVDGYAAVRGGTGMWKYWALLFVAFALVLAYTYVADPCNRLLRTDFARMRPGHVLLDSGAEMGSAESVRCRISYRDPEGQRHEALWLYQYHDTAWEFGRVVETDQRRAQTQR